MYALKTEDFEGIPMTSAYAPDGGYIGDEEFAKGMAARGIAPELAHPTNKVCSIGFCENEQKWYGWSHRAIYGFGIGSTCKKGDCGYRPKDKEDFLSENLSFWTDTENHTGTKAEHVTRDGVDGVYVSWLYNDTVPNEAIRGNISGHFTPYPETWGCGEWTAETLDDAKQMAIDFADGVS